LDYLPAYLFGEQVTAATPHWKSAGFFKEPGLRG
jgi:hypothetical protein